MIFINNKNENQQITRIKLGDSKFILAIQRFKKYNVFRLSNLFCFQLYSLIGYLFATKFKMLMHLLKTGQ
jgi:hypothetical protein